MKMTVISALAILVLLAAIVPNVIASQGYWTPHNTHIPQGTMAYHIFLVRTYQSFVDRSYRIVNQNLTACLDFDYNDTDPKPKPLVCHPIKENEIPRTNDSLLDVGYFIIPKESDSGIYTKVI
jgi:hypothetical protein